MYSPGDIVVGYPDYYESDGKKYIRKEYNEEPGCIDCSEDKTVLLTSGTYGSEVRHLGVWTANKNTTVAAGEYKHLERMCYKDIKGMVVEVDERFEKRPHWDGIVKVLVDEKFLWFWARNLRIGKFGSGYTP